MKICAGAVCRLLQVIFYAYSMMQQQPKPYLFLFTSYSTFLFNSFPELLFFLTPEPQRVMVGSTIFCQTLGNMSKAFRKNNLSPTYSRSFPTEISSFTSCRFNSTFRLFDHLITLITCHLSQMIGQCPSWVSGSHRCRSFEQRPVRTRSEI